MGQRGQCGTYTYLPALPTPNRANKAYGERNHAYMATASGSNLPFSRVTPQNAAIDNENLRKSVWNCPRQPASGPTRTPSPSSSTPTYPPTTDPPVMPTSPVTNNSSAMPTPPPYDEETLNPSIKPTKRRKRNRSRKPTTRRTACPSRKPKNET